MIKVIKQKIYSFLFGNIEQDEAKKFGLLSAAFFFIIGSYWTLRALKNAIIKDTAGVSCIPTAKKISVIAIICLLLVYTKLIDRISKYKLFYVICFSYTSCFLLLAYLYSFVHAPWLGFSSYAIIESFGSLTVALFWAFAATIGSVSGSKRGYVLIFSCGQIGALLGTTLVRNADTFGIPLLIVIGALSAACIPFIIRKIVFLSKHTKKLTAVVGGSKKAGLLEGIRLIFTRPYVLGIFFVAALYEIVVTIFDYQMQLLASKEYCTTAYASFNAFYGQLITMVAFIFAFLGTKFFINRFGFRFCLVFFPSVIAGLICYFYMFPSLWVALSCMVTIKGLSYGFNNPVKEIIYVPTSQAIKFKAKSWIELFGNRSSKAGGATINSVLGGLPGEFAAYATVISLSLVGVWFLVALFMGDAFNRLMKNRKIVK